MSEHDFALVAMGANLDSPVGKPVRTFDATLRMIAERGVSIRAVSRYFETPCFPAGAGPDYVNAALVMRWESSASEALAFLHKVETRFARERDRRWGQRTLDLDLIAMGDAVLPEAATHAHWRTLPVETQMTEAPCELILPHPRLQDRAFVLVPLCDIAPDWRHPLLGKSVAELCDDLPDAAKAEVKPM